MNLTAIWNADYIDAQYERWKSDPNSLSREWRFFFEGFELAAAGTKPAAGRFNEDHLRRQARVQALIYRYRDIGHLMACLDPLAACPTDHPLLNLAAFSLTPEDLTGEFYARRLAESDQMPLGRIIQALKETYCHSIGVEFTHLQDPDERSWLLDRMETTRNRLTLEAPAKRRILQKLFEAALFEQFINKKYIAVTRFSLEGGDAIIPALDSMVDHVVRKGCREIILGMSHRGRLNVQAHILNKPYEDIFGEFENCYNPDDLTGAGDVKYHNGYLADLKIAGDQNLRMFLMNNPSHLEAVDPVVEGFVRARQDIIANQQRMQVLPVLIHGDAAFAGQGIVTETLNMSQLAGYRTDGTIHLVINNQIGYTTLPEDARSTRYSTDVAKMLMVPIFHVHGEDPEALVHIFQLAADYRWEFGKDVVIDVVCYRRYGHNEGDEPYFTQPQMYEQIRQRPSLHRIYADKLIEDGVIQKSDPDTIAKEINTRLETAYDTIHGSECPFPFPLFYENWEEIKADFSHAPVDTGVKKETLLSLAQKLNSVPKNFALNPKLERMLQKRQKAAESGHGLDWSGAEALAFGSLLTEGFPVRLSGQDSGRGTFSQRHSVLVDIQTGENYVPLNALGKQQAAFNVYNSLLSEAGVLGFEYGYSLAQPHGLTIWEAQFGDFVNNAQSIIDLFIASGESKWQRLSGLVLMLPHGFEGLGPEHSSARLERFLQLCAADNIQVCYPSTPAQYFHLLRRQVKAQFRKPLVILTPKSLLRLPAAVSTLEALTRGSFRPVIEDQNTVKNPKTVLFCSGKIYYELAARHMELEDTDIALLRIEQFYPFPEDLLRKLAKQYSGAKKWAWVQEEPENMGGWQFIRPRLEAIIGQPLVYIGREAASSPATGFPVIFRQEQNAIIEKAVGSPAGSRQQAEVS
ncbi:MAG: 2-oxoglutarate dehydrogenase E1 component [Deltaproteobacteria bacterium]|nr:2-oxoglutarate dehydrogenase E1 component [Deltaproteobacteria bacterium]